jgi:ribosomal protein S18 acetylase RimI-like enzyme
VALGVRAKNDAAIKTYERIGFEKLGEFNTFSIE